MDVDHDAESDDFGLRWTVGRRGRCVLGTKGSSGELGVHGEGVSDLVRKTEKGAVQLGKEKSLVGGCGAHGRGLGEIVEALTDSPVVKAAYDIGVESC